MRYSTVLLCSVLLLCGSLFASSRIIHEDDLDKIANELKNDEVRNAYLVSVNIDQINYVQDTNAIYVRYQDNSTVRPLNITGNGPFSFSFASNYVQMGLSVSESDFNSSVKAAFYIFNNLTNQVIASDSITQVIAKSFPNTSKDDAFTLWPTHYVQMNQTLGEGIQVVYTIKYEGVLDVFGLNLRWALWKVVAVVAAAKVGASFLLALLDWCFQPLYRTSTMGKFSILFGNFLWLVFGGFMVGLGYMLAGFILIITCIFSPFGFKLVQIGVFAMMPFGREIRNDEEYDDHTCSTIGNILWIVLIGLPIVLTHVVLGVVLTILIVTFPFALQHFKLAKIALMPFGHSVVFRENLGGSQPYERAPLYASDPSGGVRYA